MQTSEQNIQELLTRGVEEVIDKEHLKKQLLSGKKLRIKLGIDPTSPNIHLGRAIPLLKLRDFQNLGHTAVFIIGDSTGVIGDSSDKESERPMLSPQQVKANSKTYLKQALTILNKKNLEVHYNSKWLKKLGYLELATMANQFGLREFIARDVIAKRLQEGTRVSYLETMYPLFQGYDSVMVKANVELGGTDQRFNLLTGRQLQRYYNQEPQDIIMSPLLEGTDGRKMSSSWGNTINLLDSADDMFGKVMSIPDKLIEKYFVLATRVPMQEIQEIKIMANPRDQKAKLAFEVVKMYHGEMQAQKAEEEFNKTFRDKEPTFVDFQAHKPQEQYAKLVNEILVTVTGAVSSTSAAKRLIEAGAVEIDGRVDKEWDKIIEVAQGDKKMKIGKRTFVNVTFKR